jgi:hypothetical protein
MFRGLFRGTNGTMELESDDCAHWGEYLKKNLKRRARAGVFFSGGNREGKRTGVPIHPRLDAGRATAGSASFFGL